MTKSVVDVCTCDECVEGNGFCARILVVVRSIIQKSSCTFIKLLCENFFIDRREEQYSVSGNERFCFLFLIYLRMERSRAVWSTDLYRYRTVQTYITEYLFCTHIIIILQQKVVKYIEGCIYLGRHGKVSAVGSSADLDITCLYVASMEQILSEGWS